jgi:RNA-directed DNA polymerase
MTAKDDWRALPWKQFQVEVAKLQTRIFKASRRGDVKTVHRLQRLLLRSRAARYLAVRRVTQDNRGKKTAGVDGVKALSPRQRLDLAESLTLTAKAQPTRRVWIPKPGKAEQRPLGIPTMRDRATQALVKLALEPEWEAKFEPNSYGFRPGRSVRDAVVQIHADICRQPKYVLDADIASCFDRIDHRALLKKLRTFPRLRRVIRQWLEAGVLEGQVLSPTTAGTPQGGVISPLLANIALHGFETAIRNAFPERRTVEGRKVRWKPHVVRYADDFVVLHQDLAAIERVRQLATDWLAGMGLELKPSKTRITHTLRHHQGAVGFDFLGFHVRQYPVGYHRSGKARQGFKTLIKPSPEAQQRQQRNLAGIVKSHRAAAQGALIDALNYQVDGWANYYRTQVSSEVFSKMDHLLYQKLRRWSRRRHPGKSRTWVANRYWRARDGRKWVFATTDGKELVRHSRAIVEHVKVAGDASPHDGNVLYWASRLGRHPELSSGWATLLRRQGGRCAVCELLFQTLDEAIECDHVTPLALHGSRALANRQLVHGHCHDSKTASDGSDQVRRSKVGPGWNGCRPTSGGTHDKGRN